MVENVGVSEDGVVYIDTEDGLKRLVGNTKLYVKLLNKFKVEADLEGILSALRGGDYEDAQVKAHTLKGIAANLSLKELFLQTQKLEAQIKNKSVDPEMPGTIRACYGETVQYVDKVTARYG
ncbi:MAG: Hpt domain-containing protein [Spirochaetaceae bacterium]|nr:Hpt domain-containing protein [Spirochaetaceae bacterium]